MSTNSQEQEVDLGQLFQKFGGFFSGLVNKFFDFIFFLQKKIVIIIILLAIGIALAYLLAGEKNYNHELAVIPNFDSNEYLYKKIDHIDIKIREKDTAFFKKIGIADFKNILSIKIEAYPGIYEFINSGLEKETNFKMIELMAEDGDLNKILSSDMTSINFFHHKITIKTKGMWKKEKLIEPILNYLNANDYFAQQQLLHQENIREKLAKNDSLSKQIDAIIFQLSTNSNTKGTISISEASDISKLVDKKDQLVYDSQHLRKEFLIYEKIIKEESSILNTRDYDILALNPKIIFPLVLVFMYLISFPLKSTYQKHKLRIEQNNNQ